MTKAQRRSSRARMQNRQSWIFGRTGREIPDGMDSMVKTRRSHWTNFLSGLLRRVAGK